MGRVRAPTSACWSLKKEAEEKIFPASGLELAQPKSLSLCQSYKNSSSFRPWLA